MNNPPTILGIEVHIVRLDGHGNKVSTEAVVEGKMTTWDMATALSTANYLRAAGDRTIESYMSARWRYPDHPEVVHDVTPVLKPRATNLPAQMGRPRASKYGRKW